MCRVDPAAKASSMSAHHQLLRVDDDHTSYMRCLHVIDRNIFEDDAVFDNLDKDQNRYLLDFFLLRINSCLFSL